MSDPDSNLEPGMTLDGRYELVEEIARGGFGLVYRARQLNMDREVAIKMVPPDYLDLPDVVQRFEREARLASRLNHPNTITVHDYGQHEDYLFLVMELLQGEDLADVLARDRTVELDRVADISRQVLKSLNEAHQHGIIHRDLKPENIFLTQISGESDFVKVVDFGIAKLAMPEMQDAETEEGRKLTVEGDTVGTPTYMSPEQAAGGTVDARSDLYALGVMMYEMAAGEPPFDAEEPAQLMREHIFKEVPDLPDEQLRNSWLRPVVKRAMAKDKDERYQDASSFIDAIDYAIKASNDDRAFAPTQEHDTVDPEAPASEGELEEDSVEFVNETSSDEHTAQEAAATAHSTPTDSPEFPEESDGSEPAAIQAPAENQNTSSSIMTVLEESSDDDVIVLDESDEAETDRAESQRPEMEEARAGMGPEPGRREPGLSRDSDPRSGRETNPPAGAATGPEETADESGERPARRGGSTPAEAEPNRASRGEDFWSMNDESGAEEFEFEDSTRTGAASRRKGRSWPSIVVLVLALAAAIAGIYLYLNGLPAALAPP